MKTLFKLILTLVGILSGLFMGLTALAIVLHFIGSPAGANVDPISAILWCVIYHAMSEFCLCAIDHLEA